MRRFCYALVIGLSVLICGCDQSSLDKNSSAAQTNTPATNPYVSAEGEFITLKADNLTQHQIITFMSTQLGFEAKLAVPLDKTISVNVVNVTLREALKTVLSGNPYSVALLYESQVDALPKSVTITAGGGALIGTQTSAPQQNDTMPATSHSPVSPVPAAIDNKQVVRQSQNEISTNNPPIAPDEPDFLEGMTGTKEDADKVLPMLKDPKVSGEDKEAIINMLQAGEHDDVIEPLNTALQDKNPDVVKAAIEAIVFLGNQSDVETLKKLRDSTKNEDIRQTADDGITFLE